MTNICIFVFLKCVLLRILENLAQEAVSLGTLKGAGHSLASELCAEQGLGRTRGSEEVVGKTHITRVLLSFLMINLYLLLLDCQEKKKKLTKTKPK